MYKRYQAAYWEPMPTIKYLYKNLGFIVFSASILSLPLNKLNALELNFGVGEFNIKQSINPLFSNNISLDLNTLSLSETHQKIGRSKYYYNFNFEYFDSDTLNKITDFSSKPLTTPIPFAGGSISDRVADYTQLPVPADYRMRGINLDFGFGYELHRDKNKQFGMGINTGLSLPFMEVHNMKNTVNLLIELADRFDTEIKTYKLGASAFAQYQLKPDLNFTVNTSYNLQTGQMDNNIVGSGIDISGSYFTLTSNLIYQPKQFKGLAVNAGYTSNHWDYDSTTVSTPIADRKIPRVIDTSFSANNFFAGLGYHF